ncbi:ComEC/Rec2 family competence protein [Humibacter soli]
MIDLRLAIPALAAWAGGGVSLAIPGAPMWMAIVLWSAAVAAAGAAVALRLSRGEQESEPRRWKRAAVVAAAVCVAGAAAALVCTAAAVALPARHPDAVARLAHHTVTLRASVTSLPVPAAASPYSGGRVRFSATVTALTAGDVATTARMPVQVFTPTETKVQIGETVAMTGTVIMLEPGSETAALVYASARPRVVAPAPPPLAAANAMRRTFSQEASALPGDGGDLLPGLAIGDVHEVSTSLSDAMKQASLTHLTAVSGANCAVVVSLVAAAAGAMGLGRGIRSASSLVALAGFVVLVTPQPSVLRAAVMATVIVFGAWSGRPGRAVPALSLAIIALLCIDPWLAVDYGFALSVLATGALLLLAPPMTERMSRWMPSRVAALLAVPIAAQVACQPVLLLLNPTVPLYGVVANLVAEPAAPIATVLGLVSCVLTPLWPLGGSLLAHLAWLPSAWIAAVARVTQTLPASGWGWVDGAVGFALMLAVTLAIVLVVMRPARRASRLARVIALAASGGLIVCSLAGMVGGRVAEALERPSNWSIAACDIGQGDAVLLQSKGAHALVDVGPDAAPLKSCLSELGISHIDLLVLTHYDQDHVGGVGAVIGKVGVAMVGPPTDAHGQAVDAALSRGGAQVTVAQTGDSGRLGDLDWRVLWPDADPGGMDDGNERSVAVAFDGDGLRSIFLGDLDERAQSALLATDRVQPVDVVKVAHHGSSDQDESLYQRLDAAVALVSCGAENDYGHPTAQALGILRRAGTQVMRTDVQGMLMVTAASDGSLRTWTQKHASTRQLAAPGRSRGVGGAD